MKLMLLFRRAYINIGWMLVHLICSFACKFRKHYASATALAAPSKDLGESGAAVRIYTGQEWPIFKVIFDPFLAAPASLPLNIFVWNET